MHINNGSPSIWAELSRIHMILGDRQKAMGLVEHALSFWPDNPDLLFAKSVILLKENKLDSALEAIRKVTVIDPDQTDYRIAMAEIYRKRKEWEKSISIWNQVSESKPDFPQAHLALIELHANLGQTKKCHHHMDILMKNKPGLSISELIRLSMKNPETKIYLPDPAVLEPVIQSCRKYKRLQDSEQRKIVKK
jgi:tetratricopeptide (TPR) repeat protein